MKKLFCLLLVALLALSLVACGGTADTETQAPETNAPETNAPETDAPETDPVDEFDPSAKSEGVMTYAEYAAAEMDAEVVIEAYVQAHQSWWDNKVVVYLQDPDGAYFAYNLACSEEDAAKLTKGTKIKVTGYKGAFNGEIEILDGTFEFGEGTWVAEPMDVTALLGTDELINYQNMFVSFKGMTVEASKDADGNDVAFLYKWNGTGTDGDDLYFNVSVNGQTYNFTVESYLTGKGTDVYEAVKALQIGDVIDMEGFLYWYEGVNPHITAVSK